MTGTKPVIPDCPRQVNVLEVSDEEINRRGCDVGCFEFVVVGRACGGNDG